MGSIRLPGKILLEVAGVPMLEHLLHRVSRAVKADAIVIATTTLPLDNPVADFAREHGAHLFRGAERDVLSRYYYCAQEFGAQNIVRVTGDCPMLDPHTIDEAIDQLERSNSDYVSTGLPPITYPNGMGCEAFTFGALEQAHKYAKEPWHREHVTTYIKEHARDFECLGLHLDRSYADLRLTVDTPEDYKVIKFVIDNLYPEKPEYNLHDVITFIAKHRSILSLNKHIRQKTTHDGEI